MGMNTTPQLWNESTEKYDQRLKGTNGAAHVAIGSAGGAGAVTTLLSAVTATGAGTTTNMLGGRCSFQAVANGTSGAFSATVVVQVSNDNTNWETLGTISLAGTATTADSDGFASDAPWAYVRGNVTAISGTDANVTLTMAV